MLYSVETHPYSTYCFMVSWGVKNVTGKVEMTRDVATSILCCNSNACGKSERRSYLPKLRARLMPGGGTWNVHCTSGSKNSNMLLPRYASRRTSGDCAGPQNCTLKFLQAIGKSVYSIWHRFLRIKIPLEMSRTIIPWYIGQWEGDQGSKSPLIVQLASPKHLRRQNTFFIILKIA